LTVSIFRREKREREREREREGEGEERIEAEKRGVRGERTRERGEESLSYQV